MLARFDLEPDLFDAAIRADQEGDAMGAEVFSAEEKFFTPDAVGLDDLLVLVRKESEGEFEFLHELLVRLDRVRTDAEYHGALFGEVRKMIAEGAGFLGAAGGVILGIKIHDDVPAFIIGQGDLASVLGSSGKIRGLVPF